MVVWCYEDIQYECVKVRVHTNKNASRTFLQNSPTFLLGQVHHVCILQKVKSWKVTASKAIEIGIILLETIFTHKKFFFLKYFLKIISHLFFLVWCKKQIYGWSHQVFHSLLGSTLPSNTTKPVCRDSTKHHLVSNFLPKFPPKNLSL